MGHPEIENRTPFAFEALFVADEEGRPIVAPIVKATFEIGPDSRLSIAEKQLPILFAGEPVGVPGESSYRYEPETAFVKPATDVILIGSACAPRAGTTTLDVEFNVGKLTKRARVTGDRRWGKGLWGTRIVGPEPFEKVPLTWERAYGGWDRSAADPKRHSFEQRNPVGVGYRGKGAHVVDGAPLPNVEDPRHMLRSYGGKSVPVGFGFTSPDWHPRSTLAGTYDAAWARDRKPLLPTNFDRRFFNAAPEGLVATGYLRGDEPVLAVNVTSQGRLTFKLPGITPPRCHVSFRYREDEIVETRLDTVLVDTDHRRVSLTWRAHTMLRNGPLDVRAIRITAEGVASGEPARSEALGRPEPVRLTA